MAIPPTPDTRQAAPPGCREVEVRTTVHVPHPPAAVWGWLDNPRTFVDGQVWPYRVEFVHAPGTPAFTPGVRNLHHGPLLHLPAVVGAVHPGTHRELVYLYGAYVGSPRLLRPSRLVFDLAAADGGTRVQVSTAALVHRWFAPIWRWGLGVFWRRFGRWADRALTSPR